MLRGWCLKASWPLQRVGLIFPRKVPSDILLPSRFEQKTCLPRTLGCQVAPPLLLGGGERKALRRYLAEEICRGTPGRRDGAISGLFAA